MKAEIDEHGSLTIRSEQPLESFALKRWYELWSKGHVTLTVETLERAADGSGMIDKRLGTIEPH